MKDSSEVQTLMIAALRDARRGLAHARPNPMVGALVWKGGRVIGRGWHARCGGPHAEVVALEEAGRRARGATLVVTLEPCCHFGRTPPCTDVILAAGIRRVVAATLDPNPEVAGMGVGLLRRRGVKVEVGLLAERAMHLNEGYFSSHVRGRPWVTLKLASTLDGKLAAADGTSRYISGPETLKLAHRLRAEHHAILVGRGTVEADDPELTARLVRGTSPVRVVLDSRGRLSGESKVFDVAAARTVWITGPGLPAARIRRMTGRGVEHLPLELRRGVGIDPGSVLGMLLRLGLQSVMVEGGSSVGTSFLKAGLVDRLVVTVAPKLLGAGSVPIVGDLGIRTMRDLVTLTRPRVEVMGQDAVLQGYLQEPLELLADWRG